MDINDDFPKLLKRISCGEATDDDLKVYNQWCQAFQEKGLSPPSFEEKEQIMLKSIQKRIQNRSSVHRLRRIWHTTAVAAVLIFIVVLGGYYLWNNPQVEKKVSSALPSDISPGSSKAVLTLANGRNVDLDQSATGKISTQVNNVLIRKDSNVLSYQNRGPHEPKHGTAPMNSLTVPKGGQYQVMLSDGTKVWLNSASSIRYPVLFTGKTRKVFVTGEVYMEVAEDVHRPFIVTTEHTEITVLGTHFNLMSYHNEPAVKATLLEGSIKITIPGQEKTAKIIQPNQQAIVGKNDDRIRVKNVEAADAATWIQGYLSLDNYSVEEFMNQIARWYNVTVVYKGAIPDKQFGGFVNRNARLSDVLSILRKAGISTRMEGRQLIVLKQKNTTE